MTWKDWGEEWIQETVASVTGEEYGETPDTGVDEANAVNVSSRRVGTGA